jgi:hypothetical protein
MEYLFSPPLKGDGGCKNNKYVEE